MDYNTASEILQGIMEDNYLEEEQVEAMELAINVLHDKLSEEDDIK